MTRPLEVTQEDINQLKDFQLTNLLCQLLRLEAARFNIAARSVNVALNITVSDDGEDGRIQWTGGPSSTNYIPNRLTMFQCKATNMPPGACAKELRLKRSIKLKPQVEEVLDAGGSYILFTTQALNKKQIRERIKKMREALKSAGKPYADTTDLDIYDANKIRDWTNCYVPAITAVCYWRGRPLVPSMQTWEGWSQREEYLRFPFVPSDVSDRYISQLQRTLSAPQRVARIVGLPGLGKTRLALEAFRPFSGGGETANDLHHQVVYVDAALDVPGLAAIVSEWCAQGFTGILVVDNCDLALHQKLQAQVTHSNNKLSLLTINSDPEEKSFDTPVIRLNQSSDNLIKEILKSVYSGLADVDLDQIARHAEGFPRMAVMLAEARLKEAPEMGSLTDDQLVRRLLWGNKVEDKTALEVISACALFEHVGYMDDREEEYLFVAEQVAGSNPDEFYRHIEDFKERGVIEQRGRYIRVAPPPLAVRLAADWWRHCRPERARKLILASMPGSLPEALCDRVSKLDFLPKARELVKDLCGEFGPFGQEEVLNSERGSRLFHSLAEVDPDAAAHALERVFGSRSREDLLCVEAGRRNLIGTIEKLCFRRETFSIAARLLLAFAAAENEHWSNNATGIFKQLFQVYLSGTEAPPKERLLIIDEALAYSDLYRRTLAVQALGQALQTSHFGRSGGAEYQGSGPPLEDWQPKTWQEVFDYWGEALKRLTGLALSKDDLSEIARDIIANNIRGLVAYGRVEELEHTIVRLVEQHGSYWPKALEQIQLALRYEGPKISQEGLERLQKWAQLLQPQSISERLQLLVSVPPWADVEKGTDGRYIDQAEERAKALAEECAHDLQSWLEHLSIILQGEQRQAVAFGLRLGQCAKESHLFIEKALEVLASLDRKKANPTVLAAFFGGLKDREPEQVQRALDFVAENEALCCYLVDLTRLAKPALSDLERVLRVVQKGCILVSEVEAFSYGSVLAHLPPKDLISFTNQLLAYGSTGAWIALETLFLYQHGDSESWKACKLQLRKILMSSELNFIDKTKHGDLYQWEETASKLLQEGGEQALALTLTEKILEASTGEYSSLELNHAFQPVLKCLLQDYRDTAWPLLSNVLLSNDKRTIFCLTNVLGACFKSEEGPEVLFTLSDDFLLQWCEAHPTRAPAILAGIMPPLYQEGDKWTWSPLARTLIDRYGEQQEVLSAITANLGTFSWSGSAVSYYEKQVEPLEQLRSHPIPAVRRWAGEQLSYVQRQINSERSFDEERSIGIFGRSPRV